MDVITALLMAIFIVVVFVGGFIIYVGLDIGKKMYEKQCEIEERKFEHIKEEITRVTEKHLGD